MPRGAGWRRAASVGLWTGVCAAVLTLYTFALTFVHFSGTPLENAISNVGLLGLPAVAVGLLFGAVGLASTEDRRRAAIGLGLSIASAIGWIAMFLKALRDVWI